MMSFIIKNLTKVGLQNIYQPYKNEKLIYGLVRL